MTPQCLTHFATLAPGDPEAEELVSKTYEELLDQLGVALSPETIAAMRKNEKPFEVPDQNGADLHTLQRRMKEFEELVRKKEWDTPAVRSHLLGALDRRLAALGVASEKQSVAQEATWKDFTIALPRPTDAIESPDGRYLVSTNCGPGTKGAWTINVYDRKAGTLTEVPGATGYHSDPFFSVDGSELRFPMEKHVFRIVPFKDGVADWSKARVIGEANGVSWPRDYEHGVTPHRFVAGYHPHQLAVFDTSTNTRTKVKIDEFLETPGTNLPGAKNMRSWGVVPGTDDMFLLYSDEATKKAHVVVASLSADGVLKRKEIRGSWKYKTDKHDGRDPYHATFTRDGKKILLWGGSSDGSLTVLDGVNATPRTLFFDEAGERNKKLEVQRVEVNPKTGELAVLYKHPWTAVRKGGYSVEILDPDTLAKKGAFDLPKNFSQAKFSADGETMLANDSTNEVLVINYQQKTN